jgi:succinoglycan biosynthesis transport protein ExoP
VKQNEAGPAGVGLRELEREAEANQALFEAFLGRFKETSEQESIQQPDARIISRADVPLGSSYPKKKIIVGAMFLVSLVIGVMLIMLIEKLDNGFRNPQQIEQITGVATLGMIPLQGRDKRLGVEPEDYIVEKPTSSFAELFRTLRAGLMLSGVDNPPKVIVVSSSVPGEGKTVVSISLGRIAAMSGQKVVLVECDLRRPRIAKMIGASGEEGLLKLLESDRDDGPGIYTDRKSGLHVIPADRRVPNPADVLGSMQMRKLIERLRQYYDFVVLDTPPILAVSDARVLSTFADKTLFLVRWASTPRPLAINGIRQLIDDNASLAGVVMTQVKLRKHARYGYGDSGYYYGRYREYYEA